jgi:hypothetical protein
MAVPTTFEANGTARLPAVDWPDRLVSFSAAAVLAFLPFQNSFLQNTPLGGFGAALSLLPLLVFTFLVTLRLGARWASVTIPNTAIAILSYILLITIAGMISFEWQYKGVSLLGKAVLAAVQWLFMVMAIAAGACCQPRHARTALMFAWIANTAGFIFFSRDIGAMGAVNAHISFSSEPSHFGLVTAMIGLMLAHLTEKAWRRWIVLVATVATILLSGSKGALAVLALVVAIAGVARTRHNRRRLLLVVPVLLLGSAALLAFTATRIEYDLANFTSTVTRLSGVLTALQIGLEHPFGVGFGGFYPAFSLSVARTWPLIQALFGLKINLSEVLIFAHGDDRNLSSKAFLFDTLIYFGWPGIILLLYATVRLAWAWLNAPQEGAVWLAMALCFAILAMSTYNTVIPMYVIPTTFGMAWRLRRQ